MWVVEYILLRNMGGLSLIAIISNSNRQKATLMDWYVFERRKFFDQSQLITVLA